MAGRLPTGEVTIFDDDYYYMGPVIAELLKKAGCNVTFVTTSNMVCSFGNYTSEQPSAQKTLINLVVKLIFSQNINSYNGKEVELSCMYTDNKFKLKADSIVMITARLPIDSLYYQLQILMESGQAKSTKSIRRIGDAEAPAPIASAVYAGRKYALEIDDELFDKYSTRRDINFIN
jgi:dimethylamine/trimethylamine dehydrogenase